MQQDLKDHIALLRALLLFSDEKVVFLTGAGVSLKSGIPLYRASPGSEAADKLELQSVKQTPPTPPHISPASDVSRRSSIEARATSDRQHAQFGPPEVFATTTSSTSRASSTEKPIWDGKLEKLATKRAFLANPRAWYLDFWFDTHHVDAFLKAMPNETHYALALLALKFPRRVRIITQNVDDLHGKSGCGPEHLIEIHGRVGLYRCSDEDCLYGNREVIKWNELTFSQKESEDDVGFGSRVMSTLTGSGSFARKHGGESGRTAVNVTNFRVPRCPKCKSPAMPLTLFFDEMYQTHEFLRFEEAKEWLVKADHLIFIGTSFSVFITSMAKAFARHKHVWNINPLKDTEEFDDFIEFNPKEVFGRLSPKTAVKQTDISVDEVEVVIDEELTTTTEKKTAAHKPTTVRTDGIMASELETYLKILREKPSGSKGYIHHLVGKAEDILMAALVDDWRAEIKLLLDKDLTDATRRTFKA